MSSNLPEVPPLVMPTLVPQAQDLPHFIALVIDGKVFTVMNLDGLTTAAYLSNPEFIHCERHIQAGMYYRDGQFTNIEA
jgi:hypothetical protein